MNARARRSAVPAVLPFFKMECQYQIAADSKTDLLFEDGSSLLALAIGLLEDMHDLDTQPPNYWAARHLLKMAQAAYDASAGYVDYDVSASCVPGVADAGGGA